MPKVEHIRAREILDSRGHPTVEAGLISVWPPLSVVLRVL